MKWETIRLKDACVKIGSGATPKGGKTVYVDQGISFVRSQNVYNLTFEYEGLTYLTDEAADKLKGVTVQESDVLLNITGDSIARTCIVPKDVLPARVNQHVAIIRTNPSILRPRFLNYYLSSPYMQSFMLNVSVGKGASRNAMTKEMIENFEVPCPDVITQRKVEQMLSPYDDLIENNRRQIKLLEEAAQRLYREWYVELRFPGHEDVKIVDGVPEGWKKVKLQEICPVKTGKKDANFGTTDGKYPFFTCAQAPIQAPSYSFDCSAVILAGNGDFNVKIYRGQFEAYQRTYVLSPLDLEHLFLLFNSVRMNMDVLTKGASGSTIKFLTKGMIDSIELLIPPALLLDQYNKISESIQSKVELLKRKIDLSTEVRDMLLPKLMSGEMEVSS